MKITNLEANIDSLKMKFTNKDLEEIASQICDEDVAGDRPHTAFAHTTWKYANTPRK
ncbi:hypothetical protein BAE44_0003646 [Dichanthelium oligosanthes]|uniref:Uncharacterized protein n=1 Tax=Dichanthelium oligosanthes TaxID=888268 RepID=A0A1E5WDC8_9POAL|nr:hypothetical protein BAE44_0003646 [Dichanthelium oligosanthes]